MTPKQCKMARAALDLGIRDVAEITGIGVMTISKFENGADSRLSTVERLQQAFEARGVRFIDADEHGGPGVRTW